MIYIQHRVNTLQQLNEIKDISLGCEIDLRSNPNQVGALYLSHDPFFMGEDFEKWLSVFKEKELSGPLILNTKEDGLETYVQVLLKKYNIQNYFFLDTALPTLVKSAGILNDNFAVRYSQFEPSEFVLKFMKKANWLWVDCFDNQYPKYFAEAKQFKICLVSPELQGFSLSDNVGYQEWKKVTTAICTKKPEMWKNL